MQLLQRLIVPLVVAIAAVDCRSQLDPDSVHPINTQRGSCKSKFCELFGGTCGVYGSSADCKGRLEKEGCKGQGCKCCIPEPDNQCLANEGGNSVLWNKMNTAKMAIQETINEGNADVIDILDPKIDLLEDKMNYVISQLESLIEHRGTSSTTLTTAATTSTSPTMPTTTTGTSSTATTTAATTSTSTTMPTTTTGPIGCPGIIIGEQCMVFSEDTLSWMDAIERCSRNGSLVSIKDPDLVLAYAIANYNSDERFWVGASDIANEGSWVWLDEHPVTLPFPWATGQPDNYDLGEDCMTVPRKGGFNDVPCELEYKYICEIDQVTLAISVEPTIHTVTPE